MLQGSLRLGPLPSQSCTPPALLISSSICHFPKKQVPRQCPSSPAAGQGEAAPHPGHPRPLSGHGGEVTTDCLAEPS